MRFARRPIIWTLIMLGAVSIAAESWAAKSYKPARKSGGSVNHAIAQIPAAHKWASDSAIMDTNGRILAYDPRAIRSKRRVSPERDLASALIQSPSPATKEILAQHGIPAIADVPPIFILSPQNPRSLEQIAAYLGF